MTQTTLDLVTADDQSAATWRSVITEHLIGHPDVWATIAAIASEAADAHPDTYRGGVLAELADVAAELATWTPDPATLEPEDEDYLPDDLIDSDEAAAILDYSRGKSLQVARVSGYIHLGIWYEGTTRRAARHSRAEVEALAAVRAAETACACGHRHSPRPACTCGCSVPHLPHHADAVAQRQATRDGTPCLTI